MSRRGITITSTAGKVSRAFKIVVQFYAFERCISGDLVPPSANTDSVFEAGIELKRGYSQTPVFFHCIPTVWRQELFGFSSNLWSLSCYKEPLENTWCGSRGYKLTDLFRSFLSSDYTFTIFRYALCCHLLTKHEDRPQTISFEDRQMRNCSAHNFLPQ